MKLLSLPLSLALLSPLANAQNQLDLSANNLRTIASAKYYGSSPSGMLIRVKSIDMDKDGDLDIVYAAHHYSGRGVELAWLENARPKNTAVYQTKFIKHIINDAANFYHFEVEDIDKDGDLDVLGATKATTRSGVLNPYQGKHIWLFKNDGQQKFTRQVIADTDADQLAIADFNLDGRLDFISAYGESATLWSQNKDGEFTSADIDVVKNSTPAPGRNTKELSLAVALEANGDNRPDVLIAGASYYRLFLNNADGSWTEKNIARQEFCQRQTNYAPFDRCISYQLAYLQVADIDGDGDDDIGIGGSDSFGSELAWLEQKDNSLFDIHRFPTDKKSNYQPVWQDVDGDGDIDVVFANERVRRSWEYEPPTWGWYENTAGKSQTPAYVRHGMGSFTLGDYSSAAGDFNGDGVSEFIIANSASVRLHNPVASVQLAKGFHNFGVDDSRILSVNDNNKDADIEQTMSISASHGKLSFAASSDLTYVSGDGELDRSITVRGKDSDLNNALNGLLYQPDNNYFGLDTIMVTSNDSNGSSTIKFPFWVLGVGTVLEADKHFTKLEPLTVSVKVTEAVNGLDTDDFIISGGATQADEIKRDETNPYLYHLKITPVIFTDILIQLPANKATGNFAAQNTAAQLLICSPTSSVCGTPPTTTPGDTNNGGNPDNVGELADSSEQSPTITIGTSNEKRTQSLPYFNGQLGSSRYQTEVMDLDKDGDVDFVMGIFNSVGNGGLIWFENTGQNSVEHPSFTRHILENGTNTYHYQIVDLDGDSDLDIVAATQRATNVWAKTRQDRLAWFERTENGFTKHTIESSEGGSSVNVVDFNGDNKKDLLVSNRNGTRVYYHSVADGEIRFSASNDTVIEGSNSFFKHEESVQTLSADFDQNGSLEIFVAEANGRYRLIQKTGVADNKAEFSVGEPQSGDFNTPFGVRSPSNLRSGDINGDGWDDIISAGAGSGGRADLVIYLNDKSGGFSSDILVSGSGMDSAKLADIDRDGDLDIIYSTSLQVKQTAWLENTGNNSDGKVNWKKHTLNSSFYSAVDSADFNGDDQNDWLFNSSWLTGSAATQRSAQLTHFGHNQGYALTVSHPNEDQILQLRIQLDKGSVTLANFSNIAFEQGDGKDDKSLTIRGKASDINTALNGLIYAMDPAFKGKTAITLTVSDGTHSHTQTLSLQILAVDLTISGPVGFTVNQPITLDFSFTQGVTGFTADDIQLSGSATQAVGNSFNKINDGKYQIQVKPVTNENLLVKVNPNVASSADQAKNSGALALFCATGACVMASGSSDTDGRFPQAGKVPGTDNPDNGDNSGGDGSSGGDKPNGGDNTSGGDKPNGGDNTNGGGNNGNSGGDGSSGGSGSGGGGSAWYLLLALPALTLRRKQVSKT
ncbi:FG-GAP repeat domain-containing protein [Bacterioplanoides sp.]|uniref:FG-GAP repeat domain-containing protein n=1 Tax=Bacterioplanoides sp. TaxID=2066072 RepID=UPI003B59855E